MSIREGERELGELLGDTRVMTSAPAPGEFTEAIARVLDRPDRQALVLTIASSMSAAHHAAMVAAREFPATRVSSTRWPRRVRRRWSCSRRLEQLSPEARSTKSRTSPST